MSESDEIPQGLFDPVSCRNSRWTIVRAVIMKGRIKCRVKNHTTKPDVIRRADRAPVSGQGLGLTM